MRCDAHEGQLFSISFQNQTVSTPQHSGHTGSKLTVPKADLPGTIRLRILRLAVHYLLD